MKPSIDRSELHMQWLVQQGRSLLEGDECLAKAACQFPWQLAVLQQQRDLRRRARHRFPQPERWLWTDRSLAQASDWWSALYKASLFPCGASVVDACCGAGVDAVALAMRCDVVALDHDPLMTLLTSSNSAAHQVNLTTRTESISLAGLSASTSAGRWLHIDPDRRPGMRRTNQADQFSPPVTEVLRLTELFEGAVVKLAPSTRMEAELERRIESESTRCWLGNMGECRQQLMMTGELRAADSGLRTACLAEPPQLPPSSSHSSAGEVFTYSGQPAGFTECTFDIQRYVYDLHPVLHASELHTAWAAEHGLQPIGGEHGYFTGDQPLDSPWAQSFEFAELLPWDDRQVRRWLRGADAGTVEVKNRLVRLDANAAQRRYSGSGSARLCLLVTQFGDRIRAIVARRT